MNAIDANTRRYFVPFVRQAADRARWTSQICLPLQRIADAGSICFWPLVSVDMAAFDPKRKFAILETGLLESTRSGRKRIELTDRPRWHQGRRSVPVRLSRSMRRWTFHAD